jgi:hypothetical protein
MSQHGNPLAGHEGYFFGSCVGELRRWQDRALAAEALVARLTAAKDAAEEKHRFFDPADQVRWRGRALALEREIEGLKAKRARQLKHLRAGR